MFGDDVVVGYFFDYGVRFHGYQFNAAITAFPTSSVVAGRPVGFKSAVTLPEFRTASIARFTAAASSFKPKLYSNIDATEPMAPNGFALFCPAMSGAEPCTGS